MNNEKLGFVLFFFGLLMLINLNIQQMYTNNINSLWALVMYLLAIVGATIYVLAEDDNVGQHCLGRKGNCKCKKFLLSQKSEGKTK